MKTMRQYWYVLAWEARWRLRQMIPSWVLRLHWRWASRKAAFAIWLHGKLPAKPLRVFGMDDCDYVAARGPWLARLWYDNEHGTKTEEVSEARMDQSFQDGDPDEPGVRRTLSFSEGIEERIDEGERAPFLLCTDSYYC